MTVESKSGLESLAHSLDRQPNSGLEELESNAPALQEEEFAGQKGYWIDQVRSRNLDMVWVDTQGRPVYAEERYGHGYYLFCRLGHDLEILASRGLYLNQFTGNYRVIIEKHDGIYICAQGIFLRDPDLPSEGYNWRFLSRDRLAMVKKRRLAPEVLAAKRLDELTYNTENRVFRPDAATPVQYVWKHGRGKFLVRQVFVPTSQLWQWFLAARPDAYGISDVGRVLEAQLRTLRGTAGEFSTAFAEHSTLTADRVARALEVTAAGAESPKQRVARVLLPYFQPLTPEEVARATLLRPAPPVPDETLPHPAGPPTEGSGALLHPVDGATPPDETPPAAGLEERNRETARARDMVVAAWQAAGSALPARSAAGLEEQTLMFPDDPALFALVLPAAWQGLTVLVDSDSPAATGLEELLGRFSELHDRYVVGHQAVTQYLRAHPTLTPIRITSRAQALALAGLEASMPSVVGMALDATDAYLNTFFA